jgi:transposase
MTYLLELHDVTRFSSSKKLSSYLGLTPSQHSSGEHVRLGHITREGNSHVRRALVESAWTVIRHDPVLRDKYNRIRAKGSNGKKAIVAVARSLAIRLRRCLLDEIPYVTGVC